MAEAAEPLRVYWDACIFLSYVNAEEGRVDVLDRVLADSHSGRIRIYTSVLSIAEVAYAHTEQSGELDIALESAINALWTDDSTIQLIEVYGGLCLAAQRFIRESLARGFRTKPMDALHLVAAIDCRADEFHTYDKLLLRHAEQVNYKICLPYSDQLPFANP